MDIRIKTGFFKSEVFNVSFTENEILFAGEGENISIAYNKICDVTVNEIGKTASLIIACENESIETVLNTKEEAESFVKEVQAKLNMPLKLSVDFKSERRTKK